MDQANQVKSVYVLPPCIWPALSVLLEARQYAEQTSGDRWEFAVEIEQLIALGLSLNDFRWLVRKELVEHQREVTLETDDGRAFRPSGDLSFPARTCFVLTDKGIAHAKQISGHANSQDIVSVKRIDTINGNGNQITPPLTSLSNGVSAQGPSRPAWDAERRCLRFNGMTVKHFKWTAQNQEAILSAFEEEGWPPRIDDPLPPQPDQDSKRRLSDTIKCLNRKQDNPIVRFRGNGTGEGIIWEVVDPQDADDDAS